VPLPTTPVAWFEWKLRFAVRFACAHALPGENSSVAGGGLGTWPGLARAGVPVPSVSAATTMPNERSFLKVGYLRI